MINPITKNFIECHNALIDRGIVKSSRQFALSLDSHAQAISEIVNHKRNVSIELLRKLADTYPINSDFLLLGVGNPLLDTGKRNPNHETTGLSNILFVPAKAHAHYLDFVAKGNHDEHFLKFSLPDIKYQSGEYRCFEAQGDSMEPLIYSGDKLVCSKIIHDGQFQSIRNNFVYVIVTKSEILIKRVINNPSESHHLVLYSENDFYEEISIPSHEILEIWRLDSKISTFLHSPSNSRNSKENELDDIKSVINLQNQDLKQMNATLERLLKSSRKY